MCIAIFNKSVLLSYDTIKNSFENNNDGAGLLWIENGALQVFKEATSLKRFWKKYKAIRESNALPMLLHFRIGTHGNFADYNLHPFLVNSQIGFVHNGVIRITETDARYSDTNHFNRLVLQTMKTPARIFKDGTNEAALVSHFCSTNSKLIFLNASGAFRIFNEAAGHWDKSGNWFSNNTYKACAYRDFGGTKVSKTAGAASCYDSADFYGGNSRAENARGGNYYGGGWLAGNKTPEKFTGWIADNKAPEKVSSAPAAKPAPAAPAKPASKPAPAAKPAAPASTPAPSDYYSQHRAACLALLGYGENDLGADAALAQAFEDYDAHSVGSLYAAMLYK
jgi:predicted glutamine amidotransferase